jgi:hypothetical protein
MGRKLAILVLSGCLAGSACNGSSGAGAPTSPTSGDIKIDVSMTMAPGQRTTVDGSSLSLQFSGVSSDSRCPADAFCVQLGEAVAVFEATLASRSPVRLELGTGEARRAASVGEYRIELRGLEPYPFGSLPAISPSDYRATVHVAAR